jgi:hypothetical protein
MTFIYITLFQIIDLQTLNLLFYILSVILIILIAFYFVQRYRIKKKKEEIIAKSYVSEEKKILDQIYETYLEYYKKGLLKEAIIKSYNSLRDFIIKKYNIKFDQNETEREILMNYYLKITELNPTMSSLYQIYEKTRFGNQEPSIEEMEKYKEYLLMIVNKLVP